MFLVTFTIYVYNISHGSHVADITVISMNTAKVRIFIFYILLTEYMYHVFTYYSDST